MLHNESGLFVSSPKVEQARSSFVNEHFQNAEPASDWSRTYVDAVFTSAKVNDENRQPQWDDEDEATVRNNINKNNNTRKPARPDDKTVSFKRDYADECRRTCDEYLSLVKKAQFLCALDSAPRLPSKSSANSLKNDPPRPAIELPRRDPAHLQQHERPSPRKSPPPAQPDADLITEKLLMFRHKQRRAADWLLDQSQQDYVNDHNSTPSRRVAKHGKDAAKIRPKSAGKKSKKSQTDALPPISRPQTQLSDDLLPDLVQVRDNYKRGLALEAETLRQMARLNLCAPSALSGRLVHSAPPLRQPTQLGFYGHSHRISPDPIPTDYRFKRASQLEKELNYYRQLYCNLPTHRTD